MTNNVLQVLTFQSIIEDLKIHEKPNVTSRKIVQDMVKGIFPAVTQKLAQKLNKQSNK